MADPPVESAESAGSERAASEIKVFLIADVRGYTKFTQDRGDEAAARLATRFASITESQVEAAGGSVIELRGDEALAVFGSPRQALRAAVELQSRFLEESAVDPSMALPVGIGLDAGEAVPVGDGYRGAPLNVAARLCSLASPGEILASQEVVHLARRVDGARFLDHGAMTLKGIPEPVRVIKIVAEAANPYKGLRAFDESDASDFFGREALVETILRRLSEPAPGSRFLAIVGPSGSGKSSVVRAGVAPAVRRGALTNGTRCPVAVMVPGQDPKAELSAALTGADVTSVTGGDADGALEAVRDALPKDGSELLLVVDQFEELFTLVEDEHLRQRFLNDLTKVAFDPNSRLRIIVTMRADFYDKPLLYREFGDLVGARTQTVTGLSAQELERAISGPAERAGVSLEKGLVAQVLSDVNDQPGSLPLLQYALTELFDHRRGTTLTLDAYREVGGVSGALVRRAEALYVGLEQESQDAVRQLFLRLAASEEIGITRRRIAQDEILSIGDRETMSAATETFGRARLLSFDRDPGSGKSTIEVAHEALLVEWPRLRGWLEAASEDIRAQRRLAAAAREWNDEGRDPSFLLSGSRLVQLKAWRESSDVAITQEERDFLEASIEEHQRREADEEARLERERDLERRSIRRLRALVAVMALAAIVAGGITVFAFSQQRKAQQQALAAESRELAAAALANLQADPELSILLAKEAVDRAGSNGGDLLNNAEEALHRAVGAARIVSSVSGLGGAVDWSSKGVFVTEGPENTGTIDIRDVQTGESVQKWHGHDVDLNDVAFSRDGSMLATGGDDGKLAVWDPETQTRLSSYTSKAEVWGPSFSADGSLVAAAWGFTGGAAVRIMDPQTGRIIQTIGGIKYPYDTALSPNGRQIAVTDYQTENVFVFDVASGKKLLTLSDHIYASNAVSWSPDGRRLATAAGEGSLIVWDAKTGKPSFELLGHTEGAISVDWSPDSTQLVSGGGDGTAKVWQLRKHGGRELMTLSGAETRSGVVAVFSPDGNQVITGDGAITAVKIWDASVSGDSEWGGFPTEELAPVDLAYLPDGRVIGPRGGGSVGIWKVGSDRPDKVIGPARGPRLPIIHVESDKAGTKFAVVPNFSHVATVFDLGGEELFHVQGGGEITSLSWRKDGEMLAVGWNAEDSESPGSIRLVDSNGEKVRDLDLAGRELDEVRFSPDGELLAASANDPPRASRILLWDADTGEEVQTLDDPEGNAGGVSLAFDEAGDRLAVGEVDGGIQLWNVRSGAKTVSLVGLTGPTVDVEFSPDGNTIAAAGSDGTIHMFDANTGLEKLVLRGHRYLVSGVEFSADGTRLASTSPDGTIRIWALDLADLLRIAEENLTRGFTDDECRQYLHQATCSP
jgi:WD40 repeat protein/class 3 adenylate cyclase